MRETAFPDGELTAFRAKLRSSRRLLMLDIIFLALAIAALAACGAYAFVLAQL